jgi:hypothetical protein
VPRADDEHALQVDLARLPVAPADDDAWALAPGQSAGAPDLVVVHVAGPDGLGPGVVLGHRLDVLLDAV